MPADSGIRNDSTKLRRTLADCYPPIPKPAKLPPRPLSRIRPGGEIPAISARADAARRALRPGRQLAWFSAAPLAGFYFAVDIEAQGAQMYESRWFFGDDNNDDDDMNLCAK
jgi:hypothetical protein